MLHGVDGFSKLCHSIVCQWNVKHRNMHPKVWTLQVSTILPFNVGNGYILKKTNFIDNITFCLNFYTINISLHFTWMMPNLPLDPQLGFGTGPLATTEWVLDCVLFLRDGCPIPQKRHPSWPGCVAETHNDSWINGRSCWHPAGDCPPMCAECWDRCPLPLRIHHARDAQFCIKRKTVFSLVQPALV